MTIEPAGTELSYTVTWLEMTQRPEFGWPSQPVGVTGSLLKADTPPRWYFLALYDAVGAAYAWEDAHERDPDEVQAWLDDPKVQLWSFVADGWPKAFFMLDVRAEGICDLAYFGLTPGVIGRGVGSWLLKTAILTGWDQPGVDTMTVNTCTLDHPRALGLYQKHGFRAVQREDRTRILKRPRDLSSILP